MTRRGAERTPDEAPGTGQGGSARPDRTRPAARRRDRFGRRVMWAGLLISAALHLGVWALGPELRFPVPDALRAESTLEVLPAMEEPAPPVVEVPTAPEPIPRPAEPVVAEPGGGEEESGPPPFIPHDVRPRLTNASFIQDYLTAFYPSALRTANTGARVRLWLFVTEEGRVDKVRVQSSSGLPAFDSLAVSAASVMDFRPALSGGQTVGVWVEQWIRFEVEPPEPRSMASETPGGQ